MSMPWVLVDCSWLCYRALHSMGGLSHEDVPTGVLYGFFSMLRDLCLDERVRSNRVAIFCDSRKSHRRNAYPTYKAGRPTKDNADPEKWAQIRALHRQRHRLATDILPRLGFPVYSQVGLESDDLMARAAFWLTDELDENPRRRGIMVTADGDLWQCITQQVHWYNPQTKVYYDPEAFHSAKGIHASAWGQVKTLAGCPGDGVKGIPGVGEKTAIKYLLDDLTPKSAAFQKIQSPNGVSIAKRNEKLVVLPHKKTRLFELQEPAYNVDAFFGFAGTFGMQSFIQDANAWRNFFSGRLFEARRRPK